ncbi:hypothetical protein B5E62_13220 [Lachnoclostridium sp. An118]|nr:hypothetical protein B5E62_13220 [Lachnoclostridium sp. An118]
MHCPGRRRPMSKFTRDAIKQSFLKLLNERPLSQIKVRDIVSDCGVNRNTFYYYFHDIPSLVEEMVMEQAEAIIRQYPSADTVRDFFETAISYILERKTLFLHIYHSSNREIFETYLWQMCEQIVALYIEAVLDGRQIKETDRLMIVQYLKAVSFGVISEWLQAGLGEDIRLFFDRIYDLKKGTVEEMLRRFETV